MSWTGGYKLKLGFENIKEKLFVSGTRCMKFLDVVFEIYPDEVSIPSYSTVFCFSLIFTSNFS